MIPELIGIYGTMQTGKRTLAAALRCVLFEHYHTDALVVPVSGPIKRAAFGIGWNGCKDERGRKLLQRLGDIGRECIGEDVWLARWTFLVEDLRAEHGGSPVVIVDDVRFDNEARYITGHNGIIISLEGPRRTTAPRLCPECELHATEARLVDERYITASMPNDGGNCVVLTRAERFLQDVHNATLEGIGQHEGPHGHLKAVLKAWRT